MIKVALFDLGGVLASDEWPLIYQRISHDLGLTIEKARAIMVPLFYEYCRGEFDEKSFWLQYEEKVGTKIPADYPTSFWKTTYKQWSEDVEEVWQIAAQLKKQRLRLVIFSNITTPHVEANQEVGRIARLKEIGFEKFFWSNELGMVKPEKKFFQYALNSLGLKGNRCLFVDDNKSYAKIATDLLGIIGIPFRTPGQLKRELKKLGLKVK